MFFKNFLDNLKLLFGIKLFQSYLWKNKFYFFIFKLTLDCLKFKIWRTKKLLGKFLGFLKLTLNIFGLLWWLKIKAAAHKHFFSKFSSRRSNTWLNYFVILCTLIMTYYFHIFLKLFDIFWRVIIDCSLYIFTRLLVLQKEKKNLTCFTLVLKC